MKTVCDSKICAGCKACINVCPKQAIKFRDSIEFTECIIDENMCVNCGKCYGVCPNIKLTPKTTPKCYYQGWAPDRIRFLSSSGGAASAIMEGFVKNGGYVCSCVFEKGAFIFNTTNDLSYVKKYSGSKYVKSDPQNAYSEIERLLKTHAKVLFVGLPCQSAGIINYFNGNDNLYTIDLICHGTPSSVLLNKFLEECGVDIKNIGDIRFRDKDVFGVYTEQDKLFPGRVNDSYLSTFLDAIDYTENCYTCKYASFDRVSDLTLGDAWGQLSETTQEGVSLILCQTQKGKELLELAELEKCDVDIEKAIAANHQLKRPSFKHPKRGRFMNAIRKGHSFRYAAFLAKPKDSIKECIKFGLIRLGILPDKKSGGYRLIVIK